MLKLPVSFLVIFIPTCQGIIVKCVDLDIRVYVKVFHFIDMESSQISHTLTTYRVNAKIPPRTGIYTKK